MLDNNAAVISLRDLQEMMERSGQVSEFQVALAKDLPNKKAAIVVGPRGDRKTEGRRRSAAGFGRPGDRRIYQ